jgi:hypothetical protein
LTLSLSLVILSLKKGKFMDDFVGWTRDDLIREVTRLRLELKELRDELSTEASLRAYEEEKIWRQEADERGKQGIFG